MQYLYYFRHRSQHDACKLDKINRSLCHSEHKYVQSVLNLKTVSSLNQLEQQYPKKYESCNCGMCLCVSSEKVK